MKKPVLCLFGVLAFVCLLRAQTITFTNGAIGVPVTTGLNGQPLYMVTDTPSFDWGGGTLTVTVTIDASDGFAGTVPSSIWGNKNFTNQPTVQILSGGAAVATQSATLTPSEWNGQSIYTKTVSFALGAGTYTVHAVEGRKLWLVSGEGWSGERALIASVNIPASKHSSPTITFSPSPLSFTYNGSPQGPNPNAVTSDGGTPVYTTTWSTGAIPTAAASNYWVDYTGGSPYTGDSGRWPFTINPASVTYSLSQTSFPYDGNSHAPGIAASGSNTDGTLSTSTSGTTSETNVGNYSLTASATDGNHTGSNTLSWSITAATPNVGLTASATSVYVGQSVNLTASGGPNGYTWGGSASGGSGVAATLTFNAAGSYTATVYSPAGGNYNQSNTASVTITVSKQNQTVTFSNPGAQTYGGSLALSASASSGLPVAFAVSGPATLSGSSLTFNGTGSVTVTASQAGNAAYNAAPDVSQTFPVTARPLTITTSGSRKYDGTTATGGISAALSGSLAPGDGIAYTFAHTPSPAVGTYAGLTTATVTGGETNRNASYALTYAGGYTIGKATPGITLVPNQATISSGTPVTFTASAGGSTGAYVWGGTSGALGTTATISVTVATPGSYTVTVSNSGDANYAPTGMALASLTITNTPPTATLGASTVNLILGQSLTLTAAITDPDANLVSQQVDVSTDNVNWTPGIANWSGPTAWSITGAADLRTVAFTPATTGTWYFRSHGTDLAGAASNIASVAVTVTAPAPATVKIIPKGSSTIIQDPDNTKHTQIRIP